MSKTMQIATPVIMEKKLQEYQKLAAVGKAVNAMIDAIEINGFDPTEMGEIITSMAIRKMRKNLPAYSKR